MDYDTHLEMLDLDRTCKKLQRDGDRIDSLLDHLEGIRSAIEQYGISRPMMEAVDPNGELIQLGIFQSYTTIPVEGSFLEADRCLEGIGDTIAKVFHAIIDFFKRIGTFYHQYQTVRAIVGDLSQMAVLVAKRCMQVNDSMTRVIHGATQQLKS